MKILDIALKDLKHIFKSIFSLVMMFGAPLLITGLLYFAFGGLASGNQTYQPAGDQGPGGQPGPARRSFSGIRRRADARRFLAG